MTNLFDGLTSRDYQPKQIHTVTPQMHANGGGVQWKFKCEHEPLEPVVNGGATIQVCDAEVFGTEGDYWLEWWDGEGGESFDITGPFRIESWWDSGEEIYWKPVDVEVKTEPIT